MKTKTGYKVVTQDLKSVCDTFKNKYLKSMAVRYDIGEHVTPMVEGSQLFLFDNYLSARDFVRTQSQHKLEIYFAEYVPDHGSLKLFSTLEKTFAKFVSVFKRIARKEKYMDLVEASAKQAPKGTVAAKSIMLLYQVN